MSKTIDFIDVQPSEASPDPNIIEPSSEFESEFESNSSQAAPTFPCSRVEAGKALAVSDVSIGKWIKKLSEAGAAILEGDRITADGFNLLSAYKEAKNKVAFLASIPTAVPTESALVPIASNPFDLAIQVKASDRVATLRGELATLEANADEDFGDFLALTAEIVNEDEAFTEQDDLEWQMLRQQNARKWLKRRAILERDKQQILQGEALPGLKK